MLQYDFSESIGFWLTGTHQAYMRAFQERLAPHGITYRQAQVLGWLALEGPLSQTDLAARMLIEPPSLVGVIDRMQQAGLLERRPCDQDRRKKLIHTLPAAERAWAPIVECGHSMRSQAAQGLSEREVATLKRLLKKVKENVRG
jgi:MarR family transcriptional regulator for hemolysin